MALSVEQMSRLTAYVTYGVDFDRYLQEQKIPEEDQAEAQEYWNDMSEARAALKPGEALSVPVEWS